MDFCTRVLPIIAMTLVVASCATPPASPTDLVKTEYGEPRWVSLESWERNKGKHRHPIGRITDVCEAMDHQWERFTDPENNKQFYLSCTTNDSNDEHWYYAISMEDEERSGKRGRIWTVNPTEKAIYDEVKALDKKKRQAISDEIEKKYKKKRQAEKKAREAQRLRSKRPSGKPPSDSDKPVSDAELRESFRSAVDAQVALKESVEAIACAIPEGREFSGTEGIRILMSGIPAGKQHLIKTMDELEVRSPGAQMDAYKWTTTFRVNPSFRAFANGTGDPEEAFRIGSHIKVIQDNNWGAEVSEAIGRATKIGCFERQDAYNSADRCVDLDGDGAGWIRVGNELQRCDN